MKFFLLLILLLSFNAYSAQQLEQYAGNNEEFSLDDIQGQQHTLSDYSGKVVLVNFWASWCPPCIHEMPELKKLKKYFADQSFEILAINVGEKKYKVRKFAKVIKLDLPVLLDTTSDTFNNWGVKTLPTSFLIDGNGNIRYRVLGNPGWELEESLNIIKNMLHESAASKSTSHTSER